MAGQLNIGKRERVLLIALGGTVIVAALYLLFFRGGEEAGEPLVGPTPRPTATATPPAPQQTPQTVDVFEGRDPFEPRIRPGATPGGTASPGATGGPSTGQRVVLLDIFTRDGMRFASIEVDGRVHNVKEGDTFEDTYRVVSITDECVTLVKGDERFTLCIGQEVFK